MVHNGDYDLINGRWVPKLVIDSDYVVNGTHQGSVRVLGGQFVLAGTLQGSLAIERGVSAMVTGTQQGSVTIGYGSIVTVTGAIQGSTRVERGANLIIEPGGKLAGSLSNDGTVIVRGVFGGSQTGTGQIRIEEPGYIKQPRIRDGIRYYDW